MYWTPAAIGYMIQWILALLITSYLLWLARRPSIPGHLRLLIGFFVSLTFFLVFLWGEAAFLSNSRMVLFLINPALAIGLAFLLQFSYHFPSLPERWRPEARVVLAVSIIYALGEGGYAIYRFIVLVGLQQVLYRPNWSDYVLVTLFLWVTVVFSRQLFLQCPGQPRWRAILHPPTAAGRGLRSFVWIFLLAASLNLFNILRSFYLLPVALVNSVISVGILVAMFAFVLAYLGAQPLPTSFITHFSGIFLVVLLVFLGVVAWVITPAYENIFQPMLPVQRSLRFTPNPAGGYDITQIPYVFEPELGQNLQLTDGPLAVCSEGINFPFDFYQRRYEQLFVCNDGTIGLGHALSYRTYQFGYGAGAAVLMPLLMDWDPTISEGAVFARQEPDRLIITWDRQRGFRHPEIEWSFQAVLYTDGSFVFSYPPLPETTSQNFFFRSNDEPGATFWAIGAIPERQLLGAAPKTVSLPQNGQVLRSGPNGALHDFQLDFRRYLNVLLLPFFWLVLLACLVTLAGFPLLLNSNLIQPLRLLLEGVQRVEAGEYRSPIPFRSLNELGLLTRSFNRLAGQLADLIDNLEARVQQRTAEWNAANARLRSEMENREQAQLLVIQQQRALAAFDERERLGRDLHDGMGQVLGYLNVQAQAAQTLLANGQNEAAAASLHQLAEQARLAQGEVRRHILGLQSAPGTQEQGDFLSTLKDYLQQIQARYEMAVHLWFPDQMPSSPFPPKVEEQVLYILREAIGNAAKHAQANRIDISFESSETSFHITVADDGIGFVPGQQPGPNETGQHFGLHVMRQRAAQIGANLQIASQPGAGTRLHLDVLRMVPSEHEQGQSGIAGLRVVLADDHPLFRDGLRNLLLTHGVNVIGVAVDGQEAIEKVQTLQPDLVILDLNMPRCNGLEATRRIKAFNSQVRIVVLTIAEDEKVLLEVLRSGASGYLLKNLEAGQFFQLLTDLMNGEVVVPPAMARHILSELVHPTPDSIPQPVSAAHNRPTQPVVAQLNPRQLQILQLVSQGMTYKEVGVALGVTEKTVKYHMGQILERLNVQTRAEAMAYLWQQDKPPSNH